MCRLVIAMARLELAHVVCDMKLGGGWLKLPIKEKWSSPPVFRADGVSACGC